MISFLHMWSFFWWIASCVIIFQHLFNNWKIWAFKLKITNKAIQHKTNWWRKGILWEGCHRALDILSWKTAISPLSLLSLNHTWDCPLIFIHSTFYMTYFINIKAKRIRMITLSAKFLDGVLWRTSIHSMCALLVR